jgi:hypothetical protein
MSALTGALRTGFSLAITDSLKPHEYQSEIGSVCRQTRSCHWLQAVPENGNPVYHKDCLQDDNKGIGPLSVDSQKKRCNKSSKQHPGPVEPP